jgi:hypothetical protein
MSNPGLGVRTLDKTFKAPTQEEIDTSKKFYQKVKQERSVEDYWAALSFEEKEKLILLHKDMTK